MPIEIKELVVRAVVDGGSRSPEGTGVAAGIDHAQAQALVEECVRQVLRILNRKQGR